MALNFTPVKAKESSNKVASVSLDSIPAETRDEVEEAWAYFADPAHAGTSLRVVFPDVQAKHSWVALAQSYCALRADAGKGEALWMRVSPIRGTDDETKRTLQFRMRTLAEETKRAEDSKKIREQAAAAEAKATAGKGKK